MAGKDDTNKKGFSGLSDLVSDISVHPELTSAPSKAGVNPPPRPTPQGPREALPPVSARSPSLSPEGGTPIDSGHTSEGTGAKWGIGLVVCVVAYAVWIGINEEGRTKTPSYRPSAPSRSYTPPQPNSSAPMAPIETYVQAPELRYEKPSVGRENVLTVPQICWCVREGIRVEAMRDIADTEVDIASFNGLVDDYNSRCGSFRYREGALEQAKLMVESQRDLIVSEAMEEMRQLASPPTSSQTTSSLDGGRMKRANSADTREAQEILTVLGYDPGPIDGDYGRRTSDAVMAFQKDFGLTENGVVDEELLAILRDAKMAPTPIVTPKLPAPPSSADNSSVPSTPDDAATALTAPTVTSRQYTQYRRNNAPAPSAQKDLVRAGATPTVISRKHTEIRRNNAAERRKENNLKSFKSSEGTPTVTSRASEPEYKIQEEYEDIQNDFQPIYIDPQWREKKGAMEGVEPADVEGAEPKMATPRTFRGRERVGQPLQGSHLFTVHFNSGLSQPADDVIDAGPYYKITYGRRSFEVRKELVKEVEKREY